MKKATLLLPLQLRPLLASFAVVVVAADVTVVGGRFSVAASFATGGLS